MFHTSFVRVRWGILPVSSFGAALCAVEHSLVLASSSLGTMLHVLRCPRPCGATLPRQLARGTRRGRCSRVLACASSAKPLSQRDPPPSSELPAAAVPPSPQAVDLGAEQPQLRDLLAFTVPSMGIWLASPLLSIVDVSVVGLSSTAELAALAPATALCDSSSYGFTFLSVATTSLVARARARGDTPAAQSALKEALLIAAACGLALGAVLLLLAPQLIALYTGGAAPPDMLRPAVAYSRIRALGMPFGLVMSVAQAAFLAVKAPQLPLLTVATASVVNLLGDCLLCVALPFGAAGAAWATVASQAVGAAIITSRLRVPVAAGQPSLLGVERLGWLPRAEAVVRMVRLGGPVCLLIAIKILLISVGISGAATRLSPTASAVHAVMMTLLIFFGTFGDGISAAAQSFLPALLGRPAAAFAFCRMLLATATVIGLMNCACAGVLPVLAPEVFTTSPAVIDGMRQLAPVMCAALVLHCTSMATEGLLVRWTAPHLMRSLTICDDS